MDNRLYCGFCDRHEITGTYPRECSACDEKHDACGPCAKKNAKVVGEFPNYKLVLKICVPPAKSRSELIAEGKHLCHWPTCTAVVPPKLWGCRSHWFTLPNELRSAIWAAYVPGQELRKDPSTHYLDAALAAEQFAKAEISAGRAS